MQGRFRGVIPALLHGLQEEIDARRKEILSEAGRAWEIVTANYAIAEAVKQAAPVCNSRLPHHAPDRDRGEDRPYVARGALPALYPRGEQHSAMAACIGASAAGVRTFTATSSQDLLYIHEMLHWRPVHGSPSSWPM